MKIYIRNFHWNFASGNWKLMAAKLCSTVTSILIHFPVFTPTVFPACLYSVTQKNLMIQYFDALGIQFNLDFKHSSIWSASHPIHYDYRVFCFFLWWLSLRSSFMGWVMVNKVGRWLLSSIIVWWNACSINWKKAIYSSLPWGEAALWSKPGRPVWWGHWEGIQSFHFAVIVRDCICQKSTHFTHRDYVTID